MKKFNKQFKIDTVQYYHDHHELGLVECASNLGIALQNLSRWQNIKRIKAKYPVGVLAIMFLMKPRKLPATT